MPLSSVFKASAVVLIGNGLFGLLMTDAFMTLAGFTLTPDLHTLCQFTGGTLIICGIIAWKTVDLAGDNLPAFGRLYALAEGLWTAIIGYPVITGAAQGSTAVGNLFVSATFAVLFYLKSRK
jgi:hypothetical protein